eukprot:jgi/Bigna1/67388/fgenesh1_pg.3_\
MSRELMLPRLNAPRNKNQKQKKQPRPKIQPEFAGLGSNRGGFGWEYRNTQVALQKSYSAARMPSLTPNNDIPNPSCELDFWKERRRRALMSTTGTKRKAESQASGGEPKKPKMKKKLLDLAKSLVEGDDKKRILVKGAKELWQSALDGHGVTPQEFATLRHILDVYKFTKAARIYLDSLVTKHRSGTSMYQQIDGKRYDRSCLDLAAHLAKDELISKPDAEELWKDVLDGPGVTQCEADTIAFVMEKYKCSQGAKSYLKGKLKEWRGGHSHKQKIVFETPLRPQLIVRHAFRHKSQILTESSGMDVKTSASSTSAAATAMAVDSAATATTGGWHHAASTFTLAGRDPLAPLTFEMDVGAKAYGLFVDEKAIELHLNRSANKIKQE